MSNFAIDVSAFGSTLPTTSGPSPTAGMDKSTFESAWQAVSLEPAAWAHNQGPSAIADLANQHQSLLSHAFDMTDLQLAGKSSNEMVMIMARKQNEILQAKTSLDMAWAGVKEVRKGIETVMNSK